MLCRTLKIIKLKKQKNCPLGLKQKSACLFWESTNPSIASNIFVNWRPISLLNTDYKIISKLLAKRLQKVLPSIFNHDQTGYLKGRYIGQNILLIEDLNVFTEKINTPGILLSIDYEKAFDSFLPNGDVATTLRTIPFLPHGGVAMPHRASPFLPQQETYTVWPSYIVPSHYCHHFPFGCHHHV